jgi:hypothetical protein
MAKYKFDTNIVIEIDFDDKLMDLKYLFDQIISILI